MASQQHPSSSSSRKKMATYGMPSRKRRNDDVAVAYAIESHPAVLREQDPLRGSISPEISTIKAQPSRPKRMQSDQQPRSSFQRKNDAPKRAHSTAFGVDATTMDSEQSSPPKSSVSRQNHRSPHSPQKVNGYSTIYSKSVAPTFASARRSPSSPSRLIHPTKPSSKSIFIDRNDHPHSDKIRQDAPSPVRRRRLIDALAAQRVKSPETETHDYASSSRQTPNGAPGDASHLHSPAVQMDSPSRRIDARGMGATRGKVKFTYGQARSIFTSPSKLESPVVTANPDQDDIFNMTPGRMSTPPRSPSPIEENEENEPTKHAIKSVHELRRAGAKNRFSDEMDDLLSRIGSPGPSPSTMRRNGLCELVHMLQKDEFASQFRDHASRDRIAKDIQGEKDIISAFALSAVLVIFLSSNIAPHLLRQLSDDRIGLWLGGLLPVEQDIATIAAQRSANVSKATRASLASVKNTLLQMRIWHNHTILNLSPRTLALQLLGILIRSTDSQYLLQILSDSSSDIANLAEHYTLQKSPADLNFALLISILEAKSSLGTINNHTSSDVQRQASQAATFLQATLRRWPLERSDLDAALLKLATNTTNNESGAAAFNDVELLSNLANCICTGFGLVQGAMGNNRFEGLIFDELLLVTGIFINIVEHCADARASVDARPLESLIALWQDNQKLMGEADSVEKSKLSIALGYMAVLLGYLFLSPSSSLAETRHCITVPSKGELVASIQEFILMHKSVDSRVHELEGLVGELMRQDQRERREAKGR